MGGQIFGRAFLAIDHRERAADAAAVALDALDGFQNRAARRRDIVDHQHFGSRAKMPVDFFPRTMFLG